MDGMLREVFPNMYQKIRVLAASVLFYIPLVRETVIWTGCVDAGRKTAKLNLEKGNSLIILPGGEQEQLLTEYGKEIVYLKRRKGFIKLALQYKVPVVPVYVFGASDLFLTSKLLFGPRYWLMSRFGICIPFCRGLYGSLCPLPKKVSIVFGAPVLYEMKGETPTEQEVDAAHNQFMKELELLFDTHKTTYGYGDRKLVIH
jgi:1-acyl-sn-glycerol-3-phosphate acyltransferase